MPSLLALIAFAAAERAATAPVQFATGSRLFARAGSDDGLSVGSELRVIRGKQTLGSCKVDQVASRRSSCAFTGAEAGDVVSFRPAPIEKAAVVVKKPGPERANEKQVQAALAAAAPEPFDFVHGPKVQRKIWRAISATLEHTAYVPFGSRSIQRERLDVIVDGLSLGFLGLQLSSRASLSVYSNGVGDLRLRSYEVAQLYVWQLELSSREVGRPFALAVGRLWPSFAPGLALVDGAQVGWKARDGSAEVGVVGGLLPDALRLIPQVAQYTASLYYGHDVRRRGILRALRHTGRAGVRGAATLGIVQLELEEAIDARIGSAVDLSGQLRLTLRNDDGYRPRVELAIVRAVVRPHASLEVALDTRLTGSTAADFDGFGTTYWIRGDRLHTHLDAYWRALVWLRIGAELGVVHDFATRLGRQYVGPAVQITNLAGGRLGFGLGYREELGWTRGRFAYLQATLTLPPWFRVVMRGSFAEDTLAATADTWREVGAFLHADGTFNAWLRGFVQASYRVSVSPLTNAQPMGLVLRAGLSGSF